MSKQKNHDDFGDRMKKFERRETERNFLPNLPVYARIDGRSFSKFTKRMQRPFDPILSETMIETTKALVEATHAKIGYTQSDEISLIWLVEAESQMLFDGKVQKLASILASTATAHFMLRAMRNWPELVLKMPPTFDARVFQLPTREEGANAILWREMDATKNAISMAARAYYSHKELHLKTGSMMQEMLFQKGVNFNDYPAFFKRGTFIRRSTRLIDLSPTELERIPIAHRPTGPVIRSSYDRIDMPSFRKVTNRAAVIFDGADPITAV